MLENLSIKKLSLVFSYLKNGGPGDQGSVQGELLHEQGADPEAARGCSIIADFLVHRPGSAWRASGLPCVYMTPLCQRPRTLFSGLWGSVS